jgi:hypothetical protein
VDWRDAAGRYLRRGADGKPVHQSGSADAYGLTITAQGRRLGLGRWWAARGEANQKDVSATLAIDEFGRAAAWLKTPPASGHGAHLRLWGGTGHISDTHLQEMRTVVERVLADAASP